MIDVYIFGFGLFVTILVGSALATMIVVNNRRFAHDESSDPTEQMAPGVTTPKAHGQG